MQFVDAIPTTFRRPELLNGTQTFKKMFRLLSYASVTREMLGIKKKKKNKRNVKKTLSKELFVNFLLHSSLTLIFVTTL